MRLVEDLDKHRVFSSVIPLDERLCGVPTAEVGEDRLLGVLFGVRGVIGVTAFLGVESVDSVLECGLAITESPVNTEPEADS